MKTNLLWYRLSATTATTVGVSCLLRGFNMVGVAFLLIAIGEYLVANYLFNLKLFKQN